MVTSVNHIVWTIINLSSFEQILERKEKLLGGKPSLEQQPFTSLCWPFLFSWNKPIFHSYFCLWSIRKQKTEKQCLSEIDSILFVAITHYQHWIKFWETLIDKPLSYLKMYKFSTSGSHKNTVLWDKNISQRYRAQSERSPGFDAKQVPPKRQGRQFVIWMITTK